VGIMASNDRLIIEIEPAENIGELFREMEAFADCFPDEISNKAMEHIKKISEIFCAMIKVEKPSLESIAIVDMSDLDK